MHTRRTVMLVVTAAALAIGAAVGVAVSDGPAAANVIGSTGG